MKLIISYFVTCIPKCGKLSIRSKQKVSLISSLISPWNNLLYSSIAAAHSWEFLCCIMLCNILISSYAASEYDFLLFYIFKA